MTIPTGKNSGPRKKHAPTQQINDNLGWQEFGPKKEPNTIKANQGQAGLARARAQEETKHQQSKTIQMWADKNPGPGKRQAQTTQINEHVG